MKRVLPALVMTFVLGVALDARVDPVFLRQWNDAQKRRPSTVSSSSRIAPATEPGAPFIIHGQVIDVEGKPAPAVEIFAYRSRNQDVLFGKIDTRADGSQQTSYTIRLKPTGDF